MILKLIFLSVTNTNACIYISCAIFFSSAGLYKNILGIGFNFLSLNTSMISLTGTLLSSLEKAELSWCVKMLSSNISKLSLPPWSSVFTISPCEEMVIKIQPQGSDAHSSLNLCSSLKKSGFVKFLVCNIFLLMDRW